MTGPTAASLCAGIGGLDLALEHLGYTTTWQAELDPDASAVLAHRFPGVPNLGDLTAITDPPPVDAVVAGFPCQPVSTAGRRRGTDDERWLWDDIADLLRRMDPRPRFVYLENVAGLLTANDGDALARVLHDLDALRFDAEWATLRASDVGAPHQRNRWWLVADAGGGGWDGWPASDEPSMGGEHRVPPVGGEGVGVATRGTGPAADASDVGHERAGATRHRRPGPTDRRQSPTDADGGPARRHMGTASRPQTADAGRSEPNKHHGSPHGDRARRRNGQRVHWGPYAAAVERWGRILGRPAPAPTDNAGRLNPALVEWMMGYPQGWVTDLDLSRNAMLRCLGNAVVPQQAVAAYTALHARLEEAHAA